MVTEGDRRRARRACKTQGILPGLKVVYRNSKTLQEGTLVTVPGFGGSRGPHLRVRSHSTEVVESISVGDLIYVFGPDLGDPEAVERWLNS